MGKGRLGLGRSGWGWEGEAKVRKVVLGWGRGYQDR